MSSKNVLRLLSALVLGAAAAGALAAGRTSLVIFQGSFDLSGAEMQADIGDISSPAGGAAVVPFGIANNALAVSSVPGNAAAPFVEVIGAFDQASSPAFGAVTSSFEFSADKPSAPFTFGVVIDTPSSGFIPATGSGSDGLLIVNGVPAGMLIPKDTVMEASITLSRSAISQDWNFQIAVWPKTPAGDGGDTVAISHNGTLSNTAGHGIEAIAFRRPAGGDSVLTVDDVRVVWEY